MALLLAVVMGLIPLAIAPGCFFYFDVTPKVVLLLLGTAAAAIWWAAAGGAQGFYPGSRAARWFLVALCGMAVSLAVSTLASVNPAVSLGGGNWRYWGLVTQLAALGFAYMVAACCAGRPGRLRVILRGIAVSGLLVAGYGIAQYFGWDPLLDARGYHVGEGIWAIVRPPATLGHVARCPPGPQCPVVPRPAGPAGPPPARHDHGPALENQGSYLRQRLRRRHPGRVRLSSGA